jgi:hypothetical protein
MSTSLYVLTDQLRGLQALADSDADIPEEVLRDTLEGIEGAIQVKATNVGMFVRNQESLADAIEEAAKAMKERAARVRRRSDSIRQYLLANLTAAGITSVESPELAIKIKKNPPAVIVDDESAVPDQFKTLPPPPPPPAPRVDKKAVADAIKAGEQVPGCRLEQGTRLEIKA